jgi:hypothetical protein
MNVEGENYRLQDISAVAAAPLERRLWRAVQVL